MRHTRHQLGSLKLAERKKGKVWEFRWRDVQSDGSIRRKNIVIGTLGEYPNESAAQCAVDALRLTINRHTPHQLLKAVSVETLVKHYREHELPDIFHNRKPAPELADEGRKTYSTQYAYEIYLNKWILPRWKSYRISDVQAVDVEAWLRTIPLARGSKAKIRNIMSALFSHAMRWEWAQNNPIANVRQSAKRLRTPDVLTPLEITALLTQSPEPLRTAAERAGIQKRVGFHTFRHTYTTLLTQNNEDVKVVQELLRHANSRVTLDLYAQAGMPEKRLAQSKLVRMVLNRGKAVA